MKKVITIAREYGAGGRTVARMLAQSLNVEWYDRDLILKIAEKSPYITAEDVYKNDERLRSEPGIMSLFTNSFSDNLWKATSMAIRELAEKESCIIVGRNANFILKEFDHVLRVYIHADRNWRVEHMHDMDPDKKLSQIESDLRSIDKERENYYTKLTGCQYGRSEDYDLSLNIGKLGIDRTVGLILNAYEAV